MCCDWDGVRRSLFAAIECQQKVVVLYYFTALLSDFGEMLVMVAEALVIVGVAVIFIGSRLPLITACFEGR